MKITTKGILSVLGATSLHILLGTYHAWGRLMPYYLSYLNANEIYVKYSFGIPFLSCFRLCYSLALPVGIKLTKKFGIYIPCLISIILLILSHVLLFLSLNPVVIIIAFIIFSLSIGIGYLPPIFNSIAYFPYKKGFVISIILSAYRSSSFTFDLIAKKIINPEHVRPLATGFYSTNIGKKFSTFIEVDLLIICVLSFLAVALITPWNKHMIIEGQEEDEEINGNFDASSNGNYIELIAQREDFNSATSQTNKEESFVRGLKSKPFFQLAIIFLLSYLFNALHISETISFGLNNFQAENKQLIKTTVLVWYITNSFSRLIWGSLLDKHKFKEVFLVALFMQILTFSTFYFVFANKFLFFIYNLLTAVFNSCTPVIALVSFYSIFGHQNGWYYYAISKIISSICNFGVPLVINSEKMDNIYFFLIFIVNSVSKMLATIILCFFEEKKYKYLNGKEDKNKNDYSETSSQAVD